jgi:hypothetical protein
VGRVSGATEIGYRLRFAGRYATDSSPPSTESVADGLRVPLAQPLKATHSKTDHAGTFGVSASVIRMDVGPGKEFASCYGVNLAGLMGLGVRLHAPHFALTSTREPSQLIIETGRSAMRATRALGIAFFCFLKMLMGARPVAGV